MSLGRQRENPLYDRRGVFIRDKLVSSAFGLAVAIRRARGVLSLFALHVKRLLDLARGITQVNIVHSKLERCHQIIAHRVKIVARCQIVDTMLREKAFRVVAGFGHITAQTGQVFGNDRVRFSCRQVIEHCLKARAFKVAARISVIHELTHDDDALFFTVVPDNLALVGDTF